LATSALAAGSVKSYNSALRTYIKYCKRKDFWPLSNRTLQHFIMHCWKHEYSYSKPNSTLSAIGFWCTINRVDFTIWDYTRKGMQGYQRGYLRQKESLWVTIKDFEKMMDLYSLVQIEWFALLVVSFYTLVHPSELLDITWKNVDFVNSYLTIPWSKNDQEKKGTYVRLLPPALLALQILAEYIGHTPPYSKIFCMEVSQLNPWFQSICKRALVQPYNWYALKHGGATYFAICGWTLKEITVHGRWKSKKSAKAYIHAPVFG
jgi:integrase